MKIRRATPADQAALRELWEEFQTEVPEPEGFVPETWDEEWADINRDIDGGAVYVAEDEDGAVGVARATSPEKGRSHLHLVHVRPRARRRGIAKALIRECTQQVKEKGATVVSLDVLLANEPARAVWRRLGFEELSVFMASPLDALARRLEEHAPGETRAATYVQTDDNVSVARAVAQFVPRFESPEVTSTANGWMRIEEPVATADRDVQSRLARELSDRLGAVVVALALEEGTVVRFRLYERGAMVDEYLSVPTYYGDIAKADELALSANPTLVARLTNADREEVRRVVRTAASPSGLPPGPELYESVARVLGVEP
jgi:ribosomal protein S18 acetylase RimI-like enzyme